MAFADGKPRKPATGEHHVRPPESGPSPLTTGSRLFDYRRRVLDGSLEADPIRIAHVLLRRGVLR